MKTSDQKQAQYILEIHLVPKAAKNEICGKYGNALKIRLRAPPVDGKANKALLKFLAKQLKLPPAQLELVGGQSSRRKYVCVSGLSQPEVEKRLRTDS